MKKYVCLPLMLLSVMGNNISACDLCSCFMGITPYDNQSGISLLHRYRSFSGYVKYHQSSNLFPEALLRSVQSADAASAPVHLDPSQPNSNSTYSIKDYEVYKVTELRLKYFIHQRIELHAVLPYNSNSAVTNLVKNKTSGFGDITFFAGYHLIKKIEEPVIQHRLIAGAGIKLATGSSNTRTSTGERLNYELQTGTGASDYFTYLQYIIGYKKIGLSSSSVFKISGKNSYKEQMSPASTTNASLFYKLPFKKMVFIPALQGYYEFTKGLMVNDKLEKGTQMNTAMLGPGLDVFYKNFSINLFLQLPVYEKMAENNLGNGCRLSFALAYSFNQRNYLIAAKPKT